MKSAESHSDGDDGCPDILADVSPVDAVRRVLELFAPHPARLDSTAPRAIGLRVLSALRLLQVGDLAGMPLGEIAQRVGVSRAALAWHGGQFSDACGLTFRQQRSRSTRDTMRRARLAACRAGMSDLKRHAWLDAPEE